MGLDLLDIQFRIEEKFDITLSNEDFTGLVRDRDITVGDLYKVVLKKTHLRDVARHDIRLNYQLWRGIQGAIESVTNAPRERIELKTPLATLFPRETRRETWDALRCACPYRIRELDYPRFVRGTGFTLAVGVVLIEHLRICQIAGAVWLWPVLGGLGVWMVGETYLKLMSICAPLRNHLPSGMITVKDLCRAVLATNYEDLCSGIEIPFDERCLAAWEQLREVLSDALGVDAERITYRSRLIRDLGMT